MVERDFNLSFAAFAVKPRRNDLGIVENENIAFVQDFGQLAEDAVGYPVFFGQVQKFGTVSRAGRFVGNKAAVEVKIKNIHFHAFSSFIFRLLYYINLPDASYF